jgi:hypothetical protein
VYETSPEKGHGRIDSWKIKVVDVTGSKASKWLSTAEDWDSLKVL